MRTSDLLPVLSFVLVMASTCASTQKPFDQMTAEEHHAAAAREHHLANDAFAKISGEDIVEPNTMNNDDAWWFGAAPYDWYPYEIDDPENYVAWPRITDPSEKYEDAASEHRELALRHESAAAALEGRPSPRPLPPPSEPLIPPDRT